MDTFAYHRNSRVVQAYLRLMHSLPRKDMILSLLPRPILIITIDAGGSRAGAQAACSAAATNELGSTTLTENVRDESSIEGDGDGLI